MFINKIKAFLPQYNNISKQDFINLIKISNKENFLDLKIEKDFLLTLILIKFWSLYPELIFKWGTCLNKIYFPYFRLSEDLDFVLNIQVWRTARKSILKEYENNLTDTLSVLWLNIRIERTKFDEHKLAMFTFEYKSILDNSSQTIKIDISLKNILYKEAYLWKIQSFYIDSILEENIFQDHYINCIDLKESVAEKLRASLTRSTPAIRDFFDIWYIKNNSGFDFTDSEFLYLVKIKLNEASHNYTLDKNYDLLYKQIKTDLEPVLYKWFDFNFDSIYDFISSFKK